MSLKAGKNANIVNLRDGMIDPGFSSVLYVSSTSFSVAGDATGFIRAGRGARITFATSGEKVCFIESVSYSAANNITTITVSGNSLVNEVVTKIEVSFSDAEAIKNYVDSADKKGVISGCRVVRASSHQTVNHNTYTTADFDTEEYDALEEFNTTTNKFTAKKAGRYAIILNAGCTGPGDTVLAQISIDKNDSEIKGARASLYRANEGQIRLGTSCQIDLAVGNTIRGRYYQYNYTDAGTTNFDFAYCSLQISKIA